MMGVRRLLHTDPHVVLIKPRLVPPWFNTWLALHEGGFVVYAITWFAARSRLRASLRAAGFEVDEVTTWFSVTGRRAEHLRDPRGG